MHEPDPQLPSFGTPIVTLATRRHEGLQRRLDLDNGLTLLSGVNWQVAHMVREQTGDLIRYPFHTLGFVDADSNASLVVVIHCGSGVPNAPELTIVNDGLPVSRAVLATLATYLFAEVGLASVMVRVKPDDEALQTTLLRLGFTACGRDDIPGQYGRLCFILDAATGLRRSHPRGLTSGKVC